MQDKILLFDTLNFIYRGVLKFGKPAEGEIDYTVVFNFFRNFRAIIEELSPDRVFLALEGNPQFRRDLFPEYKGNRLIKTGSAQEKHNDFHRQAALITDLLSHLPVQMVRAEHFEADDTLYTLAENLKDEEVVILSSDSDLIQILQGLPTTKLYNPMKKSYVVAPEYVYLVWKALAGDKSDNIPSLMNDKEATELSQNPAALQEYLSASEENRANFNLNRKLIELRIVPEKELLFLPRKTSHEKLFAAFEEMKFATLLKESYRERFIETFTALEN